MGQKILAISTDPVKPTAKKEKTAPGAEL